MCLIPVIYVWGEQGHNTWYRWIQKNGTMWNSYRTLCCVRGNGIYVILPYIKSLIYNFIALEIVQGTWDFCVVGSVHWRGKYWLESKEHPLLFWDRVLLCSHSPHCWYCRHVPPSLAFPLFFERILKGMEKCL